MFRLSLFSDLDSSTVSHFDKEDDLAMLLDLLLVEGLVQAGQQDISH
jgi:hypothetical protein